MTQQPKVLTDADKPLTAEECRELAEGRFCEEHRDSYSKDACILCELEKERAFDVPMEFAKCRVALEEAQAKLKAVTNQLHQVMEDKIVAPAQYEMRIEQLQARVADLERQLAEPRLTLQPGQMGYVCHCGARIISCNGEMPVCPKCAALQLTEKETK